MASSSTVPPHAHSIDDLPVGEGPGKIPLIIPWPANVVRVAKSGGDFTTVTEGIAAVAITGGVVQIWPGTYNENVTIPNTGVVLDGEGTGSRIIIAGADTGGTRVTFQGGGAVPVLRTITVVGPSTGNNPAIDASALGGGASFAALLDCVFQGGGGTATGPCILGAGAGTLYLQGCSGFAPTAWGGPVFDIVSGTLEFRGLTFLDGSGTDIIRASGTSRVNGAVLVVGPGWTSADGIDVRDTARVEINTIQMPTSNSGIDNALHIVNDGITIVLTGASITGKVNDILVDPGLTGTGSTLEGTGSAVEARISAPAGWFDTATTVMFTGDRDRGIWTMRNDARIIRNLDIGESGPSRAGGFSAGEGGPYQIASDLTTIQAYTYDASAASGARFTALDINAENTLLANIGDRLYVGVPDIFWAAQVIVGVASSAEGPWVARYWDGGALVSTSWMVAKATGAVRLGNAFMQAVEAQCATWDRDVALDWAVADNVLDAIPNTGAPLFWIVFEATATLATPPRMDKLSVRGSDFVIARGDPSHVIFRGRMRSVRTDTIDAASLKRSGPNSPTLIDVPIGTGIDTPAQRFGQNDRLPLFWDIPDDCDTSCAVRVALAFTSGGVTTITTALAYRIVASGAAINAGIAPDATVVTVLTPTGANVMDHDVELTEPLSGAGTRIDLSNANIGDRVLFDLLRTDANAGTFDVFELEITYVQWQHGGVS